MKLLENKRNIWLFSWYGPADLWSFLSDSSFIYGNDLAALVAVCRSFGRLLSTRCDTYFMCKVETPKNQNHYVTQIFFIISHLFWKTISRFFFKFLKNEFVDEMC
jgi:hypothetical protein